MNGYLFQTDLNNELPSREVRLAGHPVGASPLTWQSACDLWSGGSRFNLGRGTDLPEFLQENAG
jgi:hypothetical protein